MVKNLPANAGDRGSIPGLGQFHMLIEATRPVCHNYWAQVPLLLKPTSPRACALQQENPRQQETHAPQWRPSTTKKKKPKQNKKPTILVESVFWADCSFQTWGPQRPSYLGDLLAVKSHIKEKEAHNSCFQRLRRKTTFTCETASTTLDDAGLESKNNWEERGQWEEKQ